MSRLTAACRRCAGPLRAGTAVTLGLSLLSHHDAAVHTLCGSAFVVSAGGHVLGKSRWIRNIVRRIPRGMPRRVATDALVAAVLVALIAVVAGTGVVMLLNRGTVESAGEAHVVAAVALVVVTVVHVVRRRRRPRQRPAANPDVMRVAGGR